MQVHMLASGSSGNAALLLLGNTRILIDAGISARRIENSLALLRVNAAELDAILLTHEHIDHVKGLEVLARRYAMPVYARKRTWNGIKFNREIPPQCRREIDQYLALGPVEIEAFSISHDAADPVGFSISFKNKRVVFATDLGRITPQVEKAAAGADVLILEANHDAQMLANGPYPAFLKQRIKSHLGHLSNEQAAALLAGLPLKTGTQVFLSHLSKQNNSPEVAEKTVRSVLSQNGCAIGHDVVLHRTYPARISSLRYR